MREEICMMLSLPCDCLKRFCPRLLTSALWFAVRYCWFRMMMQTFPMIIEMRTYKIKRGLRAEFLKIFKSKSLVEHRKIGMKILGPFLSVEHDDTFFWMRAF